MIDHGQMQPIGNERGDNDALIVTYACPVCGHTIRFGHGVFEVIEWGDGEVSHRGGIGAPGLELGTGEVTVSDSGVWDEVRELWPDVDLGIGE